MQQRRLSSLQVRRSGGQCGQRQLGRPLPVLRHRSFEGGGSVEPGCRDNNIRVGG